MNEILKEFAVMDVPDMIGLGLFLAALAWGAWCMFDYHLRRGDKQWMTGQPVISLTSDHGGHTMCIVDDLPATTQKDLDDLARGTKL